MTVWLENWREGEDWIVSVSEVEESNMTVTQRRSTSTVIPWYAWYSHDKWYILCWKWSSDQFLSFFIPGIRESKPFCFHREDKNPIPRLWSDLGRWRVLSGLHGQYDSSVGGLDILGLLMCQGWERTELLVCFWYGWVKNVYSETRGEVILIIFDWFLTSCVH